MTYVLAAAQWTPALAALGDGRSWSFTPPGGDGAYGQSFGLELVVDAGRDTEVRCRRKYAIPTRAMGLVFPLFGEGADPEGALFNATNDVIARSVDNHGGNWRGFQPDLLRWISESERLMPRVQFKASPITGTDVTAYHVDTIWLEAGTVGRIGADIGCVDPAHRVKLDLTAQAGGAPVASFTRTGSKLWAWSSQLDVVVAQGPYEIILTGLDAGETWLCRGGAIEMR